MLNDFTWNMTGYIPKHAVNPYGDGIIPYVAERIFQLEPERQRLAIQMNIFCLPCRKRICFIFRSSCTTTNRSSTSASNSFSAWMAAICMTQTVL